MLIPVTNTTIRYAVMVSRRKLKREEQRICALNTCQEDIRHLTMNVTPVILASRG